MKNADLRQLELLCELIETQSLGEAAARLGMTPSAASQSLSRLRDAFATEVYVRHGNGYRLTPHGQQVIGGLRTLVARWHEALQASRHFDAAECDHRFTLACVAHSALPDVVRLQACMREQAPRARLDVQVPLHHTVDLQALRSGRLDVLCASAPPPEDARDLRSELLCTVDMTHVLLGIRHPRIGNTITLEQYLAEEHLVAHYRNLDSDSRSPIDAALVARGLPARRSCYVQSVWACLQMLMTSDFLMTVSAEGARMLTEQLPGLRCLPLPPDMPPARGVLQMIWHERTHRSRAHQWLRERLREVSVPPVAPRRETA